MAPSLRAATAWIDQPMFRATGGGARPGNGRYIVERYEQFRAMISVYVLPCHVPRHCRNAVVAAAPSADERDASRAEEAMWAEAWRALSDRQRSTGLDRYVVAVLAVAAAVVARLLLAPILDNNVPFITFFPAVLVAAWYGGLLPGLLSVVLASLAVGYFVVPPAYSFNITRTADQLALLLFVMVSLSVIAMTEVLHAAGRRAERIAKEAAESERRYRAVVEQATDAILIVEPGGRILEANAAAATMLGYTPDDLRDRNTLTMIAEEDLMATPPRFDDLQRFGRLTGERRFRRADGELLTVEGTGTLLGDGRILNVMRDVTARRAAEAERERLLAQERAARAEADAARELTRHVCQYRQPLAAAGVELRSVLDAGVRALVAVLGDGAVLRLVSEDGRQLEQAAAGHRDQQLAEYVRGLTAEPFAVTEGLHGRVVAGGETLMLADVDPRALRAEMKPEYRPYLERAPTRSLLLVPLRTSGPVIGTLTVWRDLTAQPYTDEDRLLVEDLADRIALAIQNAHLFVEVSRERAAAEAQRDRLQQVVAQMPGGVLVVDESRRFVACNPAAAAMFGMSLLGHPLPEADEEAFHAYGLRRMDGTPFPSPELPLQRAVLRGETVRGEQCLVRNARTGADVPLLVDAAPLRDPTGAVVGGVVSFQDITAIRDFERDRSEFLSSLSHDLRSPLTTIKGLAQLAARWARRIEGADTTALVDAAGRIDAVVSRMTAQLGELVDIARLHAGQELDLRREPVDLVQLVRECVESHRATSERHEVALCVAPERLMGEWDPPRLARVFDNLISNAIKYSPAGGRVTVAIEADAAAAVVTVRDDGIGIPAADLPYVFERYRRGGNVPGRFDGSGIGLAGARHIVRRHGGEITLESTEGRGTTVTVRLPRAAVAGAGI
jgi:PAS domain S-box-containing protein